MATVVTTLTSLMSWSCADDDGPDNDDRLGDGHDRADGDAVRW